MVLGEPVPPVPQSLGMARQIERASERQAGVSAFGDGCQIEDRQRNH
jgi:hypothetical protein